MESELVSLLVVGVIIFVLVRVRNSGENTPRSQKSSFQNNAGAKFRPYDAKSTRPLPWGRVTKGFAYVVDGDTVVIKKTQIRLFGIDAPEINHPYGQKAKWALVSLCKGQTIRAEIIEQDNYGRTVARCYLQDGRDLSAEMVKLGLAIDWPKFSDGEYRALEVHDARKKLWLADARQKGRIHVWKQFQAKQNNYTSKN